MNPADPEAPCSKCGGYLDWESCPECGGEKFIDRHDEDPLWYGHELYPCATCRGKGGYWVCNECDPLTREEAPDEPR